MASQARNLLSVSRHDVSCPRTCDRKSQKVCEGGKEPLPLSRPEIVRYPDPGLEEVNKFRESLSDHFSGLGLKFTIALGHVFSPGVGVMFMLQVYILVA
jgi:hypothetical protein